MFVHPDINRRGYWEKMRRSFHPVTILRVCRTFKNSPNSLSVNNRLCKHRRSFIMLLHIFSKKKKQHSLFMTQIIKEIEVLYARLNWTPLSPITIIY